MVAARVEQAVLRQRSRRHVADDGTSDERLAAPRLCLGRSLRLLRDGNAMTRADQASAIVFRRMHRHATHRNRPPLMFHTIGERTIERRGSRSDEHTSEIQFLMRNSY